jgi:hypothetical protein
MKTTKKVLGMLALVAAFGLVVVGCVTNGGRYDTSIPVEQEANIEVPRGATSANIIVGYDGKSVNWSDSSLLGQFGGKFKVSIPAGSHTLVGMKVGLGAGSAQNPEITYDFLAQHTYRVEVKDGDIVVTDITK